MCPKYNFKFEAAGSHIFTYHRWSICYETTKNILQLCMYNAVLQPKFYITEEVPKYHSLLERKKPPDLYMGDKSIRGRKLICTSGRTSVRSLRSPKEANLYLWQNIGSKPESPKFSLACSFYLQS